MTGKLELLRIAEAEARSAGVKDVELLINESASALTRFANNAIHQNVAQLDHFCSIRVAIDKRTARASTNRLDADSIRRTTADAIALARSSEPDELLPDLFEPAAVAPLTRLAQATVDSTPHSRAEIVARAIGVIDGAGQTAAGILSADQSHEWLLNSRGVQLEYSETLARFSVTAMAADSSGWAKASNVDIGTMDCVELAREAMQKARDSARPREIAPGRYTVILEPAAVLDLVGQIFGDFSRTALAEGRSFLAGRIDKQLFGRNITITDDCRHPFQAGAPFDGEGVPRQRLLLVDQGVPREVAACRRVGGSPTGHGFPLPNEVGEQPLNIVIAGGDATTEQMIRSTERGILVTRLWYIREVDPFEKLMTGMTRDGTFLIERGEVVGGVRNFRFNQSVLELLNNVELLGQALRTTGEETYDMVVPAMKAHGFNFTEVTKF